MAITLPKMSLRVWDHLNDPYDHEQLASNWAKVDLHDHTPGRGVQIPTEGIFDGAITSAKLDNASYAYKTIANYSAGYFTSVQSTNLVLLPLAGLATPPPVVPGTTAYAAQYPIYLDADEHIALGGAALFRLQAQIITNSVAPAVSFTVGIVPVTAFGGAAGIQPYVSTVNSGSPSVNTIFTTPGASSQVAAVTSGVALLDGWYAVYAKASAAMAFNAVVALRVAVQVKES